MIVDHLSQPVQRAEIAHVALGHEHHPVGSDAQDILDAMLDHQHGHAFIRQAAHHVQRILSTGRVETGKRFVQQQDARTHGQHPGQGHFLLFAAGEVESLAAAQGGDFQIIQGFVRPLDDLGARQAQVLQAKSDLVEHLGAQDLALRVLKDGSHFLGYLRQRPVSSILSVQQNTACLLTLIRTRDQAVDTANERRLATAAGPGDQQYFARAGLERNTTNCRRLPVTVAERKVFDNQWGFCGHEHQR